MQHQKVMLLIFIICFLAKLSFGFKLPEKIPDVEIAHHRKCLEFIICTESDPEAKKALNQCSFSKLTEEESNGFVDHFNNCDFINITIASIEDGLKKYCELDKLLQDKVYEEVMKFSVDGYTQMCAEPTQAQRCEVHTEIIGCQRELLDTMHLENKC
ncbi:uncharacterized protein [Parasteatoda tepidariorum]|uniref:uncharacterized protein n=1 Tax=Parasteatoda tepidariorum TaxID=114398 RepID=UPI00077FA480|nr:uncharacterized protein LOC107455521 [Parasteatoda tepidariorum]